MDSVKENKKQTLHPKKCTVYPFHPWEPKEHRKDGIVLRVPSTIDTLIQEAAEFLKCSTDDAQFCILSEDAGKILNVDLIDNDQKLYLVSVT